MRDIEISRPVLIALIGAILMGGFLFYRSTQSGEEVVPPTPAPTAAHGRDRAVGSDRRFRSHRADRDGRRTPRARPQGAHRQAQGPGRRGRHSLRRLHRTQGRQRGRDLLLGARRQRRHPRQQRAQRTREAAHRSWSIFRDEISNKSAYDGIAQAAEVTQTPGLVLVYRDKADSLDGLHRRRHAQRAKVAVDSASD